MVTLHYMVYCMPREERFETLEDAVAGARALVEGDYEHPYGFGSPDRIVGEDGTVLLEGNALSEAMWAA